MTVLFQFFGWLVARLPDASCGKLRSIDLKWLHWIHTASKSMTSFFTGWVATPSCSESGLTIEVRTA